MSDDIDPAEVQAAYEASASEDFLVFVDGLVIPGAGGPRMFGLQMADFQREFFEAIAPSLEALRRGDVPTSRRWWLERTKKASKDTDVAAIILWLMAFAERPFLGQVAAANRGQARIIEDRTREILHYNDWLTERVEVVENMIRNRQVPRKARTRIEATGSSGAAQGPTPDLLVLNELVHVERWDVMKAHMANASGVPRGIAIVATNAGVLGTPAEVWRKNAQASPGRWQCHIFSGVAPWLLPEDIEDARRLDPIGSDFARLYRGQWVSGSGSALDEDSIGNVFVEPRPVMRPEPGWLYLAGLDLGVSHDHAGVALLGVSPTLQRMRVARFKGFEPCLDVRQKSGRTKKEVDLQAVEGTLAEWCRYYRVEACFYDPAAGGSFMAQRLRSAGLRMVEMSFASPSNLTEMATCYVTAVKAGVLTSHDDRAGRLRRDFGKFSIKHTPPGKYKLEAVSDEHGHADVGTALVVMMPRAVEMLGGLGRLLPDDVLASAEDDEELTEQERKELPDELRDIYDAYDDMEDEWGGGAAKGKKLHDFSDW